MKKLFVYGLSIALVAGAASCKKSSKGKMANEWTISSMETSSTDTDASGDKTSQTMTIDGTTIKIVYTDSPSGGTSTTTTTNGTVNNAKMTVAKDGTWSRDLSFTVVNETSFGSITYTTTTEQTMTESGTWDFLNGVSKDFKKNERVVFNTLDSKTTTKSTTTDGTTSSTTSDSDASTYAEGEMSSVMVIVESKGKELQMKSEESSTSSWSNTNGGTTTSSNSSSTGMTTVTLTQE